MKLQIVVHETEEGGYWAEVLAIPGCATQGETIEELLKNVREAVEACLSASVDQPSYGNSTRVMEIAF
jgi:predicted RNase H-like HicB family nuclease